MKNPYLKIMRLDHWIKQLFIVPGIIFALFLFKPPFDWVILLNVIVGFLATCFIASANYTINEWLDAKFDKYHPKKKNRSAVQLNLNSKIVWAQYVILAVIGLILSWFVSLTIFLMELWLLVMGILYNVKPFRTKDIAYLDVLTESLNNAIRLLIGWFIVTSNYLPPISIVIGYWFAGAFLMSTKRYSEYRMINNSKVASKYRKSFSFYSERSLLLSSFFYAMFSNLFLGIFLIKYKVELIIIMPFLIGLFCYYFWISYKKDSVVQNPEKLYKEKYLMLWTIFICILFVILMFINIPILNSLVDNTLIYIP